MRELRVVRAVQRGETVPTEVSIVAEQKLDAVDLKTASSGKVMYGDSVVLHDSTQRQVVFVPFFIARSDGTTDLSVKIQTYKKAKPPMDWVVMEDKSLSINENAARSLLLALSTHLQVAEASGGDGKYLVVPVGPGHADLGGNSPEDIAAALVSVLGQPEIAAHLSGSSLTDALMSAMKGAVRLAEMEQAVSQLRQHLEQGETAEKVYQQWCDEHSWAFGSAYVLKDDVKGISAGDKLDLILPTVMSGYRDVVELKRPDMDVLLWDASHKNFYFSADVTKAIGQCHRYLDLFAEVAANGLQDHQEVVAYHPRALIVIGRSAGWPEGKHRALRGLNARMVGLSVMTYDHLLAQGERLVEMLKTHADDDDDHDDPFHNVDDDLGF
jgi:hypothetical protein